MIIYIDWDFNNILKMIDRIGYNNIETILVYDEMHSNLSQMIPFSITSQQYHHLTYLHTAYIDFFIQKDNKFANYLKQESYREVHMPSNAFTEKHLNRLYRLVEENEKSDVIFKWSHVLSCVRGKLESISFSLLENDDIAEYLFGSKERIQTLREMFTTLHLKKINIFIISEIQNKNILKWIRWLYPSFNESNLIRFHCLMPRLSVTNPQTSL